MLAMIMGDDWIEILFTEHQENLIFFNACECVRLRVRLRVRLVGRMRFNAWLI